MQTLDGISIVDGMIVFENIEGHPFKVICQYDELRLAVISQSGYVQLLSSSHIYASLDAYYDKKKQEHIKKTQSCLFEPTHTMHPELYKYVPREPYKLIKCDSHDRANAPLSVTSKTRKCRVCGCEFNGREGAKYCSSKCRKQASRLGL